jgi:hypothetical protein
MLVHGDNLTQKESHTEKYIDKESKKFLTEIRAEYSKWKDGNEKLIGPLSKPSKKDTQIIAHAGSTHAIASRISERGQRSI